MRKFLCYDTNDAASGKINVDSRGMLKPVDSELSDTSTNPVQNKVIKSALDALGGGGSIEALEAIAECGILTPAYQDGVFYTDTDGAIYVL